MPSGSLLKRGVGNERVALLRTRLIVTGDLEPKFAKREGMFDEVLEQAAHAFQKRHGLKVDGIVGPATLAALNVSVEERIRQIKLNLERWRWLPQDLGERHILVNIANFELDVIENARAVIAMRIVVGGSYRRTPVFSDRVTYLVLSPYWHVPPQYRYRRHTTFDPQRSRLS